MSETDQSLDRTPPRSRIGLRLATASIVGLAALIILGYRLSDEPHFVDESAMFSQSYFADHWLDGDRDNPDWLDYPGYDSSPLPKYLIGTTLRAFGYRRPGPAAAQRWFRDTSSRFDPPGRSSWSAGRSSRSPRWAVSRSTRWERRCSTAAPASWRPAF